MTSAALERASILGRFRLSRLCPMVHGPGPILGHPADIEHGAAPTVLRGRSTIISLTSDQRVFDLADFFASAVVQLLAAAGRTIPKPVSDAAGRHPDATRFLIMSDFAGILRPLVEALELGGGELPRLPSYEVVARKAVSEIDALKDIAPTAVHGTPRHSNVDVGLNVVDVGATFSAPAGVVPDIVLATVTEPRSAFTPARLLAAYRLLRAAAVPPALSLLLARATHRIVAGRLIRFATFEVSERDLSPLPAIYWSNVSVRSVFHASERRARGLPTVGIFTILVSDHVRYRCSVFDRISTVGTGQTHFGGAPYRLPRERHAEAPIEVRARSALIVLQPAIDILDGLADFVRLAQRAGWSLTVKHHPVQRRDRASLLYWQRTAADLPAHTAADVWTSDAQLIVTGTSTFAIAACLAGRSVVLVGPPSRAAEMWGNVSPPGLVVDPARLEAVPIGAEADFMEQVSSEARAASAQYVRYYAALPEFPLGAK